MSLVSWFKNLFSKAETVEVKTEEVKVEETKVEETFQ